MLISCPSDCYYRFIAAFDNRGMIPGIKFDKIRFRVINGLGTSLKMTVKEGFFKRENPSEPPPEQVWGRPRLPYGAGLFCERETQQGICLA
jgi:hypothetical protein